MKKSLCFMFFSLIAFCAKSVYAISSNLGIYMSDEEFYGAAQENDDGTYVIEIENGLSYSGYLDGDKFVVTERNLMIEDTWTAQYMENQYVVVGQEYMGEDESGEPMYQDVWDYQDVPVDYQAYSSKQLITRYDEQGNETYNMVKTVDSDYDWTDHQQVEFNGEVSPENIISYDGNIGIDRATLTGNTFEYNTFAIFGTIDLLYTFDDDGKLQRIEALNGHQAIVPDEDGKPIIIETGSGYGSVTINDVPNEDIFKMDKWDVIGQAMGVTLSERQYNPPTGDEVLAMLGSLVGYMAEMIAPLNEAQREYAEASAILAPKTANQAYVCENNCSLEEISNVIKPTGNVVSITW